MRYLFILDPLPSLKIRKDSSYAMMYEAEQRGHTLWVTETHHLFSDQTHVYANARPFAFSDQPTTQHDWYRVGAAQTVALSAYDAVVMRKDPPFDLQYLYAAQLLAQAERQGAKVFNSGNALSTWNEKLAILRFPQCIAPTLVTQHCDRIKAFLANQHEIIVKPLDGMGGAEIFRLNASDPNLNVILETVTRQQRRSVMVQRYIPEIAAGDKRVLLIDGKPVDWCLARIPARGETRGNLAAGGTGIAQPLRPRDREIAETVAKELTPYRLLLVGLDIIGDYLTEINVTSPTCFQEITAQSGINVAGLFIDALERNGV